MKLGFILSSLIAGSLWLSVLGLNNSIYTHSGRWVIFNQVRTTSESVSVVLRTDLQRVGYGVEGHGIVQADSTRFSFRADLSNTGTAQDVSWYRSAAGISESGEKIYQLTRVVGTDTTSYNMQAEQLRFSYSKTDGTPATSPGEIHHIEYLMLVASKTGYDKKPEKYALHRQITPPNLNLYNMP